MNEHSTIPVDKSELLEVLTRNRSKHMEEYVTALAGYQKAWCDAADKAIKKAQVLLGKASIATADKCLVTFPGHLPGVKCEAPPQDHTKDYDNAIAFFTAYQTQELAESGDIKDLKIIHLSVQDWRNYWQDDWSWKQHHVASMLAYGAPGPTGPSGASGPEGPRGTIAMTY